MIIHFWGVRGSSPTPLTPEDLRSKITAIMQRVCPEDLQDAETRQNFLSNLPKELFGNLGGNTACIEVRTASGEPLIFDMGTGLREMEKRIKKRRENIREFHIFLSHFHYDHLLGLPYFGPFYDSRVKATFYSPYPAMERILKQFMNQPYHPVGWDSFAADIDFYILKREETLPPGWCECGVDQPKSPQRERFLQGIRARQNLCVFDGHRVDGQGFPKNPP